MLFTGLEGLGVFMGFYYSKFLFSLASIKTKDPKKSRRNAGMRILKKFLSTVPYAGYLNQV